MARRLLDDHIDSAHRGEGTFKNYSDLECWHLFCKPIPVINTHIQQALRRVLSSCSFNVHFYVNLCFPWVGLILLLQYLSSEWLTGLSSENVWSELCPGQGSRSLWNGWPRPWSRRRPRVPRFPRRVREGWDPIHHRPLDLRLLPR